MMHTHNHVRRTAAVLLTAALGTFGLAAAAQASTSTSVTYDVQASAAGQTGDLTIAAAVTSSAPKTVATGGAVAVKVSVGSITVPSSADGYTVTEVEGIALKIPVPANSTYKSAALSGGSGLGTGKPTVSQASRVVTIKVPGPIAAGTTFTLPTLTLHLTAGAAGKTISTTLSGTSYTSPGLTFTAVLSVLGIPVDATADGYPNPDPKLTTTTIS